MNWQLTLALNQAAISFFSAVWIGLHEHAPVFVNRIKFCRHQRSMLVEHVYNENVVSASVRKKRLHDDLTRMARMNGQCRVQ